MATTVNPDRDPDDPLPTSIPTASWQFYELLVEELTEHARHWLGTSLSEIEFESTPIWFTAEELDTLTAKKRLDGKNESDIEISL